VLDFRQNVASLTGLRGVAALWVVVFHFAVLQRGYEPPNEFGLRTIIRHGYLAVDVFFVLSGFVMALSYSHFFRDSLSARNYGVFMIRRLARVYPLYALVTLLYVAQTIVHGGFGAVWLDGQATFVTNMLMVQSWGFGPSIIDQAWSISAEFAAYIVFPFISAALIFSSPRKACIWGALCVAGIAAVSNAPAPSTYLPMGPLDVHHEHSIYPILRCVSGFGLGMLTYRMAVFAHQRAFRVAPAWCYGVTLLLLITQMTPESDIISLALTPLFIFTLLGDNLVAKALSSTPLIFLGEISYAVYLIHGKIEPTLARLLQARWPSMANTPAGVLAMFGVFVLVTIGCATLAYRLFERPARGWLRRLEFLFDPRAEQSVQASGSQGLSDVAKH
jgi:peptidoglycan/LPS O-acetylase OafA/YrhL